MQCPQLAHSFGEAMNHDGSASRTLMFGGEGDILGLGIGNVQSAVIGAVPLARIDGIATFGRFIVAFKLFCPYWLAAQSDIVAFKRFVITKQR